MKQTEKAGLHTEDKVSKPPVVKPVWWKALSTEKPSETISEKPSETSWRAVAQLVTGLNSPEETSHRLVGASMAAPITVHTRETAAAVGQPEKSSQASRVSAGSKQEGQVAILPSFYCGLMIFNKTTVRGHEGPVIEYLWVKPRGDDKKLWSPPIGPEHDFGQNDFAQAKKDAIKITGYDDKDLTEYKDITYRLAFEATESEITYITSINLYPVKAHVNPPNLDHIDWVFQWVRWEGAKYLWKDHRGHEKICKMMKWAEETLKPLE